MMISTIESCTSDNWEAYFAVPWKVRRHKINSLRASAAEKNWIGLQVVTLGRTPNDVMSFR